MLNLKLRSLVLVSLLVVAGAVAANAQMPLGSSLKVDVPEQFIVNDKVMPAGEYTISRHPVAPSILVLRGAKESVFFRAQAGSARDASGATNIVLEKAGGSLYLSQVNIFGSAPLDVAKTKAQRDAIARTASSSTVAIEAGF